MEEPKPKKLHADHKVDLGNSPHVKKEVSKKRLQISERSTVINIAGDSESLEAIEQRPIKKSASQTRSRSRLNIDPIELARRAPKTKKKLTLANKNKNSLKELLEQYSELKNGVETEKIDLEKLNRLKSKLNSIQNLIDMKLRQVGRKEPYGIYERAAIVIQKYARGYLLRKFITKYLVRTNPTFESFEALDNAPKTDSLNSLSQSPELADVTIDHEFYNSEHQHQYEKPNSRYVMPNIGPLANLRSKQKPTFDCKVSNETSALDMAIENNIQMTSKQGKQQVSKLKIGKNPGSELNSKIPTLIQKPQGGYGIFQKDRKGQTIHTDEFDTQPKNEIFGFNTFEELSDRDTNGMGIRANSPKVQTLIVDESLRAKLRAENESGEITVKNSKKSSGELNKLYIPEGVPQTHSQPRSFIKSSSSVLTSPINAFPNSISNYDQPKPTLVVNNKYQKSQPIGEEALKSDVIIENFFNAEYKNWTVLETALQELNALVCNRKQADDRFQLVVEKINQITANNLLSLKNVISDTSRDHSFKKRPDNTFCGNPSFGAEQCHIKDSYKMGTDGQKSLPKLGLSPFSFSSPRTPMFGQKLQGSPGDDSSKGKSNRIIKKSEMDIWPNSNSQHHIPNLSLPLAMVSSLLVDRHRDSDDKFFYTEREQTKDHKIIAQCHETLSRDVSKTSFDVRPHPSNIQAPLIVYNSQKVAAHANQIIEPSAFKIKAINLSENPEQAYQSHILSYDNLKVTRNNISSPDIPPLRHNYVNEHFLPTANEESFLGHDSQHQQLRPCNSDLEYIEVPIDSTFGDATNKSICVELMIEFLLYDILDEEIWRQGLLPLSANNKESPDEDTIYGIRTNINAVNEYCNLLIKFIEEACEETLLNLINSFKRKESNTIHLSNGTEFVEKTPCWKRPTDPQLIMTEVIYLTLESQILDNYKDMNIVDELFEMQRIYHRCVFDCFNEILTLMVGRSRRFALTPEEARILRAAQISQLDIKILLDRTKAILLEKTMNLCGLIRDKEDSMMGKSVKNFDLDTVQLIREERLTKMLTTDFEEEREQFAVVGSLEHLVGSFKNEVAMMIENELLNDLAFFIAN